VTCRYPSFPPYCHRYAHTFSFLNHRNFLL
jgi:hypothetical protein